MAEKTVSVRLQALTAQYQSQMAQAAATTRTFGTTAGRSLGTANASLSTMSKTGLGLRAAVASPLNAIATPAGMTALALAGSAKAAIDWESAWAGVTKTVEGSPEQLARLETGLRGMAKELPASHGEIAAVAEAAGQLGIETDSILGFTRTMIDLGETTNLSADTAASSLARLANITQMPQDQFDRLGATVVDLGNKGAATEEEIVTMGLRIAGAGHQIGLSEPEILGFAEALSSLGIHAEMGGSAISRVMVKIQKAVDTGGAELEQFAAIAGMSSEQFAQMFRRDAAQAIVAFSTGLGKLGDEGISTNEALEKLGFTEIRVTDTLRRLAGSGNLVSKSIETANTAFDENTALSTEAEKRYETTAAQLEMFKNQVVDLAIVIGDRLLPVINGILGPLSDFVGFLADPFAGGLTGDTAALVEQAEALLAAAEQHGTAFDRIGRSIGGAGGDIASAFSAVANADFGHSSRELRLLSEAFDDTEKEAEELTDAIEALIGVHLNVDEAASQFKEAIESLRQSIEDNGDTLDINTEKGRENRDAFRSGAQAALDLANAQIEAGVSTERATQTLRDRIRELRAEAIASGISEEAVDAYIERLHLTPKDIKTLIRLFDDEAKRKLNDITTRMNALNGKTVTAFVNVVGRALGQVPGQILDGMGVRHAGGVAGGSGPMRYGARVRGDEVPTILQRGEVVLSRAQAAAGSTGSNITNVFHIDARGAQRGVGEEIRRAMEDSRRRDALDRRIRSQAS